MTKFSGTTIYSGTDVDAGLYVPGTGLTGPSFTGTSLLGSSVALDGTVTAPGQTITATIDGTTVPVTYVGFYGTAADPVYVFTTSGLLNITSFSVSPTGASLLTVLEPLKTKAPPKLPVCFLAGVLIQTPSGEIAVENLAAGDLVCTRIEGRTVARPVIWIGSRSVDIGNDAALAAYPVRVRAGAFADNIPHRDLLVTSEHCIHVDGRLVPVRMLVNGSSIFVDRSLTQFTYFHVELETHSILIADGLETESYLDTGNRANFANVPVTAMMPDFNIVETHQSWATHAAAPLAVDRDTIEPIWNRLAGRAAALGLQPTANLVALTDQPDVRLLLDNGRALTTVWTDGRRHMFHIPSGTRAVRLLSRAAVPAESIGPFVDDRRTLGIAVEKLVLWTGLNETAMPAAGLALTGWHALEGSTRWTNGNAALDLPVAGHDTFLDVHVAATMFYVDTVLAPVDTKVRAA